MNGSIRHLELRRTWRLRTLAGLAVILLLQLLLAGCGGRATQPVRTAVIPFSPEQQEELTQARSAEYRLRPGDRLAINFKYENDLDSSGLMVLPDGRLSLPGGVDPIMARGLSITELDSALTLRYARDYRFPQLSVMVEQLADLDVYVMGMVRDPGMVKLPPGGMGILQAIAAAGGFDPSARPKETVLMRVTPEGFMLRQIDLSNLQRRGFLELVELDLQPYDLIYVPRSALGDLKYFSDTVLVSLTNVSRLFWDVYAISNLDKVTNIWR
jgi:protein involved in polysaccharide export with SLBB domain